jgi:hypothetical protein
LSFLRFSGLQASTASVQRVLYVLPFEPQTGLCSLVQAVGHSQVAVLFTTTHRVVGKAHSEMSHGFKVTAKKIKE